MITVATAPFEVTTVAPSGKEVAVTPCNEANRSDTDAAGTLEAPFALTPFASALAVAAMLACIDASISDADAAGMLEAPFTLIAFASASCLRWKKPWRRSRRLPVASRASNKIVNLCML
jgi:hypothetical protein